MQGANERFMLPSGEGKSVWLGGLGVDFKIYGEQTAGSLSIVEHPIEPGRLVPPHVHADEDEYSYILQGEIGARIGNQEIGATPGSYVFKPRAIPHTFWNAGSRQPSSSRSSRQRGSRSSSMNWPKSTPRVGLVGLTKRRSESLLPGTTSPL